MHLQINGPDSRGLSDVWVGDFLPPCPPSMGLCFKFKLGNEEGEREGGKKEKPNLSKQPSLSYIKE